MTKVTCLLCVIIIMADARRARVADEVLVVPDEIRRELDQLPAQQKRDITIHLATGVGLGPLGDDICAFCRQHNLRECIDRFCNDNTRLRAAESRLSYPEREINPAPGNIQK